MFTIRTYIKTQHNNTLSLRMISIILLLLAVMVLSTQATFAATFKTYSPNIEAGEVELEVYSHTTYDSTESKNGKDKYKFEAGYGVSENWFTAVYGEIEKNKSNNKNEYVATGWENIISLTEQGKYWADFGVYFEYEVSNEAGGADKFETKLLIEKQQGDFIHSFNLIFERKLGSGASNVTEYGYVWRSKWAFSQAFAAGIEAYGEFGEVGNPNPKEQQQHRIGPVLYGEFGKTQDGTKFKYEVGYLLGLTNATSEAALKGVLEYEFRF